MERWQDYLSTKAAHAKPGISVGGMVVGTLNISSQIILFFLNQYFILAGHVPLLAQCFLYLPTVPDKMMVSICPLVISAGMGFVPQVVKPVRQVDVCHPLFIAKRIMVSRNARCHGLWIYTECITVAIQIVVSCESEEQPKQISDICPQHC